MFRREIARLFASKDACHVHGVIDVARVAWKLDILIAALVVASHSGKSNAGGRIVKRLNVKGAFGPTDHEMTAQTSFDLHRRRSQRGGRTRIAEDAQHVVH